MHLDGANATLPTPLPFQTLSNAQEPDCDETILPSKGLQSDTQNNVKKDILSAGDVLDNHYELVRSIGQGATGCVFAARDLKLGRMVAVKSMRLTAYSDAERATLLQLFKRDATATAQVKHAGVVTIHDFGQWDGNAYLVLELLEGQPLDAFLRAQTVPLPVAHAAELLRPLCEALSVAHAQNIVHRDLKPANVFICADGMPKILDFGMASLDPSRAALKQALNKGTKAIQLEFGATPSGGSPGYMAPEQWLDPPPAATADLWSIGVMLYEMTCGRLPFQWQDLRNAAWGLGPRPDIDAAIAGAPVEAQPLLHRLLAWDPAMRFPSARALQEALAPSLAPKFSLAAADSVTASNTPIALTPGTTLEGRYRLTRKLGEGGFGSVFEAEQLRTGQRVAIKLLHPAAQGEVDPRREQIMRERFSREMQVIARLRHPNIVRLIDSGTLPGDRLYIALEFVDGRPLSEVLQAEQRLSPDEARYLMGQVLDALCCAHEHGIVHRDLKPDNILISATGGRRNAVILDFGIAAITDDARAEDMKKLTRTNEVIGTPHYMAPEQLLGQPANIQTDLYAWGLIALECLTGSSAVDAPSAAAVIFQHLSPEPIHIPAEVASSPWGSIIARAVAKPLAERFPSATIALQALGALPPLSAGVGAVPQPEAAPHFNPVPKPTPVLELATSTGSREAAEVPPLNRRRVALVLLPVGVLLVVGGWWVLSPAPDAPQQPSVVFSQPDTQIDTQTDASDVAMTAHVALTTTSSAQAEDAQRAPDVSSFTQNRRPGMTILAPRLAHIGLSPEALTACRASFERGTPSAQCPATLLDDYTDDLGFDLSEQVAVLPAQTLALPALEVMTDELTWGDWHGALSAEQVAEVDAVCPGPLPTPAGEAQPLTGLSAPEAERACALLGMRLPTAREWEAIARASQDQLFPFPSLPSKGQLATLRAGVDAAPAWSQTSDGVRALAGRASEWVRCEAPDVVPRARLDVCKHGYAHRGGAWSSASLLWLTVVVGSLPPDIDRCYRADTIGVRCIREVSP